MHKVVHVSLQSRPLKRWQQWLAKTLLLPNPHPTGSEKGELKTSKGGLEYGHAFDGLTSCTPAGYMEA
eukprot:3017237-Karenia_brevis.AAC.1